MKDEAKWCTKWAQTGMQLVKQTHQTYHPEVTEMMELWVSKAMADNLLLTGADLQYYDRSDQNSWTLSAFPEMSIST